MFLVISELSLLNTLCSKNYRYLSWQFTCKWRQASLVKDGHERPWGEHLVVLWGMLRRLRRLGLWRLKFGRRLTSGKVECSCTWWCPWNTGIMMTLKCPFADRAEQVVNANEEVAVALYNAHTSTHTTGTDRNRSNGPSKSEKSRPKATQGTLAELWKPIQALWKLYMTYAGRPEAEHGLPLVHCCDKQLRE